MLITNVVLDYVRLTHCESIFGLVSKFDSLTTIGGLEASRQGSDIAPAAHVGLFDGALFNCVWNCYARGSVCAVLGGRLQLYRFDRARRKARVESQQVEICVLLCSMVIIIAVPSRRLPLSG